MRTKLADVKSWLLLAIMIGIGIFVCLVGYAVYKIGHGIQDAGSKSAQISDTQISCNATVHKISLGYPYVDVNRPVAYFTTDGSTLDITAHAFNHGGIFGPAVGTTAIYVGSADALATYDKQRSVVSNKKFDVHVTENKYTKLQPPVGRYWLWSTNGGDIEAASCGQISGVQPTGQIAPERFN